MTSINETPTTPEQTVTPAQKIHVRELREKSLNELHKMAVANDLHTSRVSKQELIFALMKHFAKRGDELYAFGILEIMSEQNVGYGFLRCESGSYLAGAADIYVSPRQIKSLKLKSGDSISCSIRMPKGDERYFAVKQVNEVNSEKPGVNAQKVSFSDLRAQFPTRWMKLERGNGSTERNAKILDMFSPLGFGQRMMIPAPPKAGKTVLLQQLADSISHNHPDAHLIVLLIDERPKK